MFILYEFNYGSPESHEKNLLIFNELFAKGHTEDIQSKTIFHMIARSGNVLLTINYRSIHILNLVSSFSDIMNWPLQDKLDAVQADNQVGFRSGICIENDMGITNTIWVYGSQA